MRALANGASCLALGLLSLIGQTSAEWVPSSISRMVVLTGDSPRASSQVTVEYRDSAGAGEENSFRVAVPDQIQGNLSALHAALVKGSDQDMLPVSLVHHDIEL